MAHYANIRERAEHLRSFLSRLDPVESDPLHDLIVRLVEQLSIIIFWEMKGE